MYYAGIDLGTSGCRLIIIDADNHLHYQTHIIYPHVNSQTPTLWWQSVRQLLRNIPSAIAKKLCAISIDGTSGTLLLSDIYGHPSSQALMYNDGDAINESKHISTIAPRNSGAQGMGSSLSKLLFLLKKYPHTPHAHALHQADWIANQLLGKFGFSDENNCLKLGYDPVLQCWPDWLAQLNFPLRLLPQVKPAGQSFGYIAAKIAHDLQLPPNLKIIAGTTDSIAAFIATGAKKIGDAVTSLGSTLTIKILAQQPIYAPEMGIYSHRLANKWLVGGASNTGGAVLLAYFTRVQLQTMTTQLNPQQLLNLNYYPLVTTGERFPVADPNKIAVLCPRPANDTEFFQAILEGIADIETEAYRRLNYLGTPIPSCIYSVGGGSRNAAWTMIRANKLNSPIKQPHHSEAAYGAALLAKQTDN
jgi:sugar (pentulose or hexulose) kinase